LYMATWRRWDCVYAADTCRPYQHEMGARSTPSVLVRAPAVRDSRRASDQAASARPQAASEHGPWSRCSGSDRASGGKATVSVAQQRPPSPPGAGISAHHSRISKVAHSQRLSARSTQHASCTARAARLRRAYFFLVRGAYFFLGGRGRCTPSARSSLLRMLGFGMARPLSYSPITVGFSLMARASSFCRGECWDGSNRAR